MTVAGGVDVYKEGTLEILHRTTKKTGGKLRSNGRRTTTVQWRSARDSDLRRPFTLDIASNDPRHRPRRSRDARSRYHSRRRGSSLDALGR